MKQLTLPTALTLPQKLPQTRSIPTIGAVATLPRLPSFNAEAIKQTEEQQALLEQQRAKEASYKKVTGLKDPNEPYVLNSAVDALFNRKAKEKHYGEFAETLHEIPVLGDIITAVPALFETVWMAPTTNLLTGDLKAYGINGLTNFSETMDILANPVKSLITPLVNQDTADRKYQLPWYERLGASVGFTDEGRYNYDYDTDFWLADFGLELISDPMTAIEIAVGIATGGSTVAAYYGAKETAEAMAEKALKEAGETLTEEAYQKLLKKATKKTAWKMAKDTVELRKASTKISRMAKSFAKSKSDNAIRTAAQNLDVALRKSKGIVDDSVKSIVSGITDSVKAYGDEASKAFLKELDDFNRIGKYTLADIFQDSVGGKLTKDAKNQIKSLEKQLAKAAAKGDNTAITQLKETMRLVLSDPASIKKYKHSIEVSPDALSLFKEIELTDYMNGLNKLIQDANNYNLLKAVDKIGDVTEAADSALLKFALMGNPTTMGVYFAIKTDAAKRISNLVSKYIIKSLTNITDWVSEKTVTQVLYEFDDILISTKLTLKKFSVFSGTDIFDLDFGKEYAQNVYDKTLNWARGFGRPEQYAPELEFDPITGSKEVYKPVNILLLSPEERKRHLIHNYGVAYLEKLGISVDDDLDEVFFKKLNEVGHYGATGERLKEWNLAEYVKSIQVNDATARLQQLYSDFTMTFTKADSAVSSPQAYIKFLADLDTPTAKTTITAVQDSLTNYADEFTSEAISVALKLDFDAVGFELSPEVRRAVSEDILQIREISEELYTAYSSLELLQATENEYLTIKTQIETIKDLQFKLRSRVSQLKTDFKKVPKDTIKQTKFAEQYRQLEKILSPYFGYKESIVENSKVLYELRGDARLVTQKVLESPEFQELVTAFRAGNDGHKILEANAAEVKVSQAKEIVYDLDDLDGTATKLLENYDLNEDVSLDTLKQVISEYKVFKQQLEDTYRKAEENYKKYYEILFKTKDDPEAFKAAMAQFVSEIPDQRIIGYYAKYRQSYADMDRLLSPFYFMPNSEMQFVSDWAARQGIYTGYTESVERILDSRQQLLDIYSTKQALLQARDAVIENKTPEFDPYATFGKEFYRNEYNSLEEVFEDNDLITPKEVTPASASAPAPSAAPVDTTQKDLEKIQNFFTSVDNYVELISLMKQSQVPEGIQDVFLDTLQNFEVKDAMTFARSFDSNLNKFIQQIDVGLAGRYQTHRFTPEYYATKLLEDETYGSKARKYLSSNRTALDEAEFMEALFDSQLLPELSKTRAVIVNGQEVEEFVNQSWLKNKNRTRVYLNFKTSGDNPSLNEVNDIGLHCSAMKESWSYPADFDETTALLSFYKKLKDISEANEGEEFVFIFQNNQNLDIGFIKRRFSEAAEVAQASENFELSEELIRARDWISRILDSRSLNNITLLKELDGVPSVGKYRSEIKRWMTAIVNSQSQTSSTMMLYLNEDIFDLIEKFPPLDASAYKEIKNALVNLVHECNEAKYLWSARMGTVALDGTFLLDGDIYKPSKELLFDDKESIRSLLQSNEVYISDKTELLELKENRWYYKQQALPEGLENANAAVKYLKSQGIEYAPSWRALNLKQQLSTYPVLINGNVSMQTIEGTAPVAFRRYVDTDIMQDFFDITKASYQEQHTATRLAQQMSTVLSRIRNTSAIDKYEELISKHYTEIIEYAKTEPSWNLYKNLKEVTDVYHKYAALVVLINDDTAGKPSHKLKALLKQKEATPQKVTFDDLFAVGYTKPIRPSKWDIKEAGTKRYPKMERSQIPDYPVWNNADIGLKEYPTTDIKFQNYPKWNKDDIGLKPYPKESDFPTRADYIEAYFKTQEYNDAAFQRYKSDYDYAVWYAKQANDEARKALDEYTAIKKYNDNAYNKYKESFDKQVYDWKLNRIHSRTEDTMRYAKVLRDINEYNAKAIERYKDLKNKEWTAYKQAWDELYTTQKILQDVEDKATAKLNSGVYAVQNEAREKTADLIWNPWKQAYGDSKFQRLFTDYDKTTYLGYSNNIYSKNEYLTYIYDSEQKGMTYVSRDLQKAFERDSSNILDATETLKRGLDENKVYAPVMQRHAAIGQSHIELNNTYIEVVGNLRDGVELDTFVACDKQIVNNLEDLIVEKVCNFNTADLTSFVYHQGKGVVIIPVSSYITDNSPHSFDLKDTVTAFAERYKNYEDELIKVTRSDGDLIIYAKNYQSHIKQELVPYKPMVDIDYDLAFKSAFGYPKTDLSWEKFNLNAVHGHLPENAGPLYSIALERLLRFKQDAIKAGASTKQLEFLLTHFEDVEKLRKAHLQHQNNLTRLATDFDDQYSFMRGGYGRVLDSSQVNELAEALPKEVREAVFGGELPEKSFYNTSEHMFNFSTLGRAAYRKKYEHFATSNYQSILAQTYRSLNNNLSSAAQYAAFYYNATGEMTQAIPDARHLVGTPVPSAGVSSMEVVDQPTTPWDLDNIFRDVSDEEVCNILKNKDEFTVSYLGVNKKGQPRVETISIVNPEDVAFARSKGAILLPSTTAGSVIQTMNNKRWANSKFKLFHKINYFLKACMLIHPGFVFRNFIDSTLKNYLVSKDAVSMSTSYVEAMDYYTRYKETVNMLFAINPDSPFRPDTMQVVFADSTAPISEEMFMLIHNFIESGPSAGSINKVSQFYLKKAAKPSLVNQMYDALLQPTKGLEQITRLAAYLEFIKKGMTNTDAFQAIAKTHFDYAAKTATTRWIELVIPFYSFQAKNFEFWLDFLNKSPVLAYTLSKYFQSVWNWEEIDFERIDYYQSQLNHIMQANIQLNKQGLTLKVNPSFMDPINIISNPIDSFASRVSPIFKPIVDAIQGNQPYGYEQNIGSAVGAVASTIPGVGGAIGGVTAIASQTANRYESGYRSYQRTGSPLPLIAPSIFGSVKTPTQYGRASYTNSRAFMDPQKRVPRRVSTYNKLYTDTGKNRWQLRYLPIDNFTVQWRIRESTNRFR